MKRFGYLGDPVSSSEALLTEEAVVYGLMKLQTFGGLLKAGTTVLCNLWMVPDSKTVTKRHFDITTIRLSMAVVKDKIKPRPVSFRAMFK